MNLLPVAPAAGQSAVGPGAAAGLPATGQGAAAGFQAAMAAFFGAISPVDGAPASKPAAAAPSGDQAKADAGDAAETDGVGADAQALAAALFFAPPALAQPQQPATPDGGAPAAGAGQTAVAATATAQLQMSVEAEGAAAEASPEAADAPVADGKAQQQALNQALAPAPKAVAPAPGDAPTKPAPAAAQAAPVAPTAVAAPETPAEPAEIVNALPAAEVAEDAAAPAELARPQAKSRTAPRTETGQTALAGLEAAAPVDAEEAPRPLNPVAAANPKIADKPSDGPLAAATPSLEAVPTEGRAGGPDALPQATSTLASATAAPQHTATAVVRGSPETVANLAADILKKLDGQSTRFDVELDPAGLGKVDVRVEIGAHGRLTASLTFDNPQAAAELRGRSGELHRALEQAGFDTSGGFSFTSGGDQSGQGLAGQQQQQNDPGGWRGRAFQAALNVADEASEGALAGSIQLQRRTDSGVDIRI